MSESLKDWIKTRALELGFADIGIMSPKGVDFSSDLKAFLDKGYQGDMSWLSERKNWRANPNALGEDCRSIIMLAENYDAPGAPAASNQGEISAYARGRDYHDVVKKRLKALGREIVAKTDCEIKVFVDTAPVMEKPLAAKAGLGWQGKHSNLVSRNLGNWFFLGAIFTTLEIEPDAAETDHCGSCRACLDACPTQAFDKDGKLDARRCISYLTIEYDGVIPEEFRTPMGNLIYGCDICLNACPWNKFSSAKTDERLAARAENIAPPLKELLALTEPEFRARFTASAIKRIGWKRFMRNCLIAAGNAKSPELLADINHFVQSDDAVLRETALWAKNCYDE